MRKFLPELLIGALLFCLPFTIYGQACTDADSGELVITPPIPANGQNFPGGTVVEMCYTLNEFDTPAINWLQSIIPTFGPGFDISTFAVTSLPTSCSGAGSWGYFDMWTACITGDVYGPGFSFDGSGGLACGGTPNDGDPGNNFGDGGFLCPGRTWCWELTTLPVSPFSCQLLNYNTTIFVYGDAETGSWNPPGGNPPCGNDAPLCEPGLINFQAVEMPTPCGCNMITGQWDNQVLGQECGIQIEWTGPGGYTSNELTNEVCVGGWYNLAIGINECVQEEAQVFVTIGGTPTMVTATANPTSVCDGEEITFSASGLGAGGDYTWTIDGETYNQDVVTVTVNGSGGETATVEGFTVDGCPADASVFYVILPSPAANITVDETMVCSDDNVMVSTTGSNNYTWDFGSATVNSGSGNGPYDLSFPSAGTYEVTLVAANSVCSDTSTVEIEVFDIPSTPTDLMCTVIGNDSIIYSWTGVAGVTEYELSIDGGTPFSVTDTFYGVGNLMNGSVVTLEVSSVGNTLCPVSPPASTMCTVFNCPAATVLIDQAPTSFCLTNMNDPIDLTFTPTDAGTLTDTTWSGPGVVGSTFDPDAAGLGTHTINLSITNSDGCTYQASVEFEVNALPTSSFTVSDSICITATSLVTYTGDADPATATFSWDFDGGTITAGTGAGPYQISWPMGGNYTVSLMVEDTNSCSSLETQLSVEVIDLLAVPAPGCGGGGLDSVSFNWPPVDGATGYVISIDGGTPMTITETVIGVGGLNEGDMVELTIFALGNAPCGNSTDTTITCVAEACPDITVLIDDSEADFCLGVDPDFQVLTIAQNSGSGMGTYVWSGTGVSNDTFYVATAGLGTHDISVVYTDGLCEYTDTVQFMVHEIPQSAFSVSDTIVCEEEIITVTNEVAGFPGATYSWDFPGATPNMATGAGPHDISYAAAGIYTISQTVTSNGCSTTTTRDVEVIAPLSAPVISCVTPAELEQVTATWTDVVPNTGYEVTVDGVVVDTINMTTYTVMGLSPDTSVVFSIRALSDSPCGDGPVAELESCSTASCPAITLNPGAPQTEFCLSNDLLPVSLLATSAGGDMTGTFTWSGNGVVAVGPDFAFDPVAAGIGQHTLLVAYVETAGCSAVDSLIVTVFPIPTADFTLTEELVCLGSIVTASYAGTATAAATYDWDFGTATATDLGAQVYELSFPTPGSYPIALTVTENNCVSTVFMDTVVVNNPLQSVNLECDEQTLTTVTFVWDDVLSATAYELVYNGMTDTVTDLSLTISNLDPEELATLIVTPLGLLPCGNGPSDTVECAALACPEISLMPSAAQLAFCLDGVSVPVQLDASSAGGDMTGTFTWMGPGVTLNGTDFEFDPNAAGIGQHTLIVNYVETAGCSAVDSLIMDVFAVPTATFTLEPNTICSDAVTTVTYTGTATVNANYDWDFDGATVTDLGDQTYELNWPAAGVYTVSLTVAEAGCTNTFSLDATVSEPLATPEPECDTITLTSVQFSWPAVAGATGYLISINDDLPFVVNGTSYTETNLTDGETVTLTIIAQGPAPCGDSQPAMVSCTSESCPDVVLDPSAEQSAFCEGTNEVAVLLDAGLTGGAGGTITWSGTGVEAGGNDEFFFNPVGLPAGDYPLTVTYTQSICSYSETFEVAINANPVAQISSSNNVLCTSGSTMVAFNGAAAAGANFDWDFDGATVTDLGGESYELSWTAAGTHQVSLVVSQNGCTDAFDIELTVAEPPVAGQQVTPANVCQSSGDLVELSELLSGADAGGIWTSVAGNAATVDPETGRLNTFGLDAGTFEYTYTVAGGACDDAIVSVFVTIEPAPVAEAGIDQLLTCEMGMVSLNGTGSTGIGELSYAWTGPDGNPVAMDPDSPMIEVVEPGIYTLTVTSEIGCSATDFVTVDAENEVPVPQIELSNISCFGSTDGTILVNNVDGGRPPYNYSLNGGTATTTSFFTGLDQGEYSLRVTDDNGCFTEIFLGLDRPEELTVSVELPDDENIFNEGDLVTITADISGGNAIDTLIWQPDTLNNSIEGFSNTISFPADESRTISVTVIDENGCMASDNTNIIVRKERSVYFPTGFSPNGDNVNDILFIGADADKVELVQEYLIFNRWGEAVFENYEFEPNDPAQGWDGFQRGEPLNPQVLVYVARVLFRNGDEVIYKGDVTLIR